MSSRPTLRSTRGMLRVVSERPPARKLAEHEDPVYCLVIPRRSDGDESLLSENLLRFSTAEQRHWLDEAARQDLCLIVVSAPDALELYSTANHRLMAFRPLLSELQIRLAIEPAAGRLRTQQLSGSAAAKRLLDRAAGVLGSRHDVRAAAHSIHNAAALASALDTLGSTLGSLCWAAASVAERVHDEVGTSPTAEDELAAERIVDEELARWRSELAQLRRTLRPSLPPTERALSSYLPEEPGSLVRIKIPKNPLGAEELAPQAVEK